MQLTDKIIFIDIDGVICTNTFGQYQNARPLIEKIDIVNKLYEKNRIVLWSSRGSKTRQDWQSLTLKQLGEWNVKYHELKLDKPYYDILVDDKSKEDLFQLTGKV